jgi:sugar lactone lactonase YvrE
LTQRADSTSAIPPGRRTPEGVARAEHSPPGDICYVAPDGRASRVAGDLLFPNGLCVSPDGRSLIVAETGTGRVLSYAIGRNGTLDSRNTLIELGLESGLDGMAFDADGRLLIAGCGSGTIYVLAPDLTGVQHTLVGEDPALTNLCSGGEAGCEWRSAGPSLEWSFFEKEPGISQRSDTCLAPAHACSDRGSL